MTIALGSLFPLLIYAQPFQFSFHQLSPLEGLSQGTNTFVQRDSRGFMWLSSIDGLNRFDGKTVKVYKAGPDTGLHDNIITSSFFEDERANLWFTTYEGVHCYLREQDRFTHYFLLDENQDTIRQDYAAFHLGNEQNLWVRTGLGQEGRLHHFNIKSLQDQVICPLDGNQIQAVVNGDGTVTALVSNGFSARAGIEIRAMTPPYRSTFYFTGTDELPASSCLATLIENDSLIWLAMENALVAFNPITKQTTYHNRYGDQSTGAIWAVSALDKHHLIVSTAAAGVLIFDKKKGRFVQQIPYDPDDEFGLRLTTVNAFYLDKQDNLWLSSARGGLNYSNLKKRKFQTVAALNNTAITALYQSKDGRVWCSGKSGEAFVFSGDGTDHKIVKINTGNSGVSPRKVSSFFEDEQDQLWACLSRYLFKWNEQATQFEYVQALPATSLAIYQLRNGPFLLSTYSGMYMMRLHGNQFEFSKFTALGVYQPQLATAVYEDSQNRLYLALDATRLVVLEKEGDAYVERKQVEQIGYAKSFHERGDSLWVATTNGILTVSLATLDDQLLNERSHQAPQENYYSILPDDSGQFWLSCNQGIIRYHPALKTHRRYNLADGLQGIEYNTNAFLRSTDGRIWLGGNKGLNVFHPSEIADVPYAPQVQLANLLINDEPYSTEVQIGELKSLDLAYKNNTISVTARALEYSDPTSNSFQYRLENYDEDWVDGGKSGFVRYPNLPPGHYNLQFKAANSDGTWSTTPQILGIYVRTPWWRSWWFYLSCILVVAAIAYTVFTYRLQQALKLERIRVKISSDLHDDVGSILTGLAMQAEVVEMTAKEENKPKLIHISELSRSALSRMRDTVWAIDARKDKLENLLFRLQEHAEETLSPKGIRFELKQDELLDLSKNLTADIRQNFYLIGKEAITNAAKHTTGNQVTVTLNKFQQGMELLIHDNGEVKDKNYQTTGLGLSNMEMRATQIGASFKIDKSNGYLIQVKLQQIK